MRSLRRGLSSRELGWAVALHAASVPLCSWLLLRLVLGPIAAQVAGFPQPERALLEDGGIRLVAAVGTSFENPGALPWMGFVLLVTALLGLLLPTAWLFVAGARAVEARSAAGNEAKAAEHSARRILRVLPRFALLFVILGALVGLLAFGAVLCLLICAALLAAPTDERAADLLCLGVIVLFALPLGLLQPLSDLGRMEIVTKDRSALDATRWATRRLRAAPRLLAVWLACAGVGWALAALGAGLSQRVDPGGDAWGSLCLELLGLLGLSCARSRWLSYAAEAANEAPQSPDQLGYRPERA